MVSKKYSGSAMPQDIEGWGRETHTHTCRNMPEQLIKIVSVLYVRDGNMCICYNNRVLN